MARNRYPGYCYCCGAYVPAGFGHFERRWGQPGNKWQIKCCTYTDITSLVADVNVNEIADHIRNGNLASWVESWQQQMAFELENLKLSEKD